LFPIAAALIAIAICSGCGPSADTAPAKPAAASDSGVVLTGPGGGGATGVKPKSAPLDPSK